MLQTPGEVSRRMHSDGVCAALCSSYVSVLWSTNDTNGLPNWYYTKLACVIPF